MNKVKYGEPIIIDEPNSFRGEDPSLYKTKLSTIKKIVDHLKLFEDHPNIDGLKIAKIGLRHLPEKIIEIIEEVKGQTTDIFDFYLIKTKGDKNNITIPFHGHPEQIGEIYFIGDGGVEVFRGKDLDMDILEENRYDRCHLRKTLYDITGPGDKHGALKIDNQDSTFFAVKFKKKEEDKKGYKINNGLHFIQD